MTLRLSDSPPAADRAMTPESVVAEITNGTKSRGWVLRRVPLECRVPVKTKPPLFWYSKTMQWWTGMGRKSA